MGEVRGGWVKAAQVGAGSWRRQPPPPGFEKAQVKKRQGRFNAPRDSLEILRSPNSRQKGKGLDRNVVEKKEAKEVNSENDAPRAQLARIPFKLKRNEGLRTTMELVRHSNTFNSSSDNPWHAIAGRVRDRIPVMVPDTTKYYTAATAIIPDDPGRRFITQSDPTDQMVEPRPEKNYNHEQQLGKINLQTMARMIEVAQYAKELQNHVEKLTEKFKDDQKRYQQKAEKAKALERECEILRALIRKNAELRGPQADVMSGEESDFEPIGEVGHIAQQDSDNLQIKEEIIHNQEVIIQDLQEALEKKTIEIQAQNSVIEQFQIVRQSTEGILQRNSIILQLQDQLNHAQAELVRSEDTIKRLNIDITQKSSSDSEELRQKQLDQDSEICALKEELDKKLTQTQYQHTIIECIEGDLRQTVNHLQERDSTIQRLWAHLNSLNQNASEIQNQQSIIQQLQTELQATTEGFIHKEYSNLAHMQKQDIERKKLRVEMRQKNATLLQLERECTQLKDKKEAHEKTIGKLQEEVQQLCETLKEEKLKIVEQNSIVRQLHATPKDKRKMPQDSMIDELEAKIESLEESLQKKNLAIERLGFAKLVNQIKPPFAFDVSGINGKAGNEEMASIVKTWLYICDKKQKSQGCHDYQKAPEEDPMEIDILEGESQAGDAIELIIEDQDDPYDELAFL